LKTILISGGNGKFSNALIKINKKYRILAPNKKQMNILSQNSIANFISKQKVDYFIHAAAFTTPMARHKTELEKSISTNIIGSANVALICLKKKIKLIYISTNFVYPGKKGNYTEDSNLSPVNEYGWSKLGGECAMQIYKNTLTLRICMNDDFFPHKSAFTNYLTSFLKKTEAARITLKLLDKKGVINIGGEKQSAYNYARNLNSKVKKIKLKKKDKILLGLDTSMNINKLSKILYAKKN
jgi:dTDP-4-dehydrorhamnose reductase